jgi:hypothetical protein
MEQSPRSSSVHSPRRHIFPAEYAHLHLDVPILISIAQIFSEALGFVSKRLVKTISRATIQIIEQESGWCSFIMNQKFFWDLLEQVNQLVNAWTQLVNDLVPPDIWILISHLVKMNEPQQVLPILKMINPETYHKLLITGDLSTRVACLETMILFVLWDEEAVRFFSDPDRFIKLTLDFYDSESNVSLGKVWLKYCHALMLRRPSYVIGRMCID